MFLGDGGVQRKRPTREHYEHEAALILERRIAEGRPPPEVWKKAEESRAKSGHASGWYTPATPDAPPVREPRRQVLPEWKPRQPVPISDPLVLRLVRLPLSTAATPPRKSHLRPRAVNATD